MFTRIVMPMFFVPMIAVALGAACAAQSAFAQGQGPPH